MLYSMGSKAGVVVIVHHLVECVLSFCRSLPDSVEGFLRVLGFALVKIDCKLLEVQLSADRSSLPGTHLGCLVAVLAADRVGVRSEG